MYSGAVVVLTALMVLGSFLLIVGVPQGHFAPSYQSVIQTKYDKLLRTDEPKIILIGGSNLAFGMDEQRLEEATGYKIVNMGLHAGFGQLFNTEIAKANINAGDIVILAYEYYWADPGGMDSIGVDMVMSGIDHRLDMYRHIPVRKYKELLGYLTTYAVKKLQPVSAPGAYASAAFDEEGRMIYDRPTTTDGLLDYANNRETYGIVTITTTIPEENAAYIREFKQYVEEQGATVYFVAPSLLVDTVASTAEDFLAFRDEVERTTGVPYISNPLDYLFPMELMYDTRYHCNNAGEAYRTELLIRDLAAVGISAQN